MDALSLLENTLNMKTIKIVDKMEDPSGVRKELSIMNRDETLKILEKQEKLIKEFKDWVWQDEKRMNTLVSRYKETNAYGFCVKKHYGGSRLKYTGLNPNVNLYQHQRDAVKRIISSPNTLFLDEAHNYKNISYRSRSMEVLGQVEWDARGQTGCWIRSNVSREIITFEMYGKRMLFYLKNLFYFL